VLDGEDEPDFLHLTDEQRKIVWEKRDYPYHVQLNYQNDQDRNNIQYRQFKESGRNDYHYDRLPILHTFNNPTQWKSI